MKPCLIIIIVAALFLFYFRQAASAQSLSPVYDGLSESEKQRIRAKAEFYYSRLPAFKEWYGQRNTNHPENSHVLFNWPLIPNADYDDIPNYFAIDYYWDMVPADSLVQLDWNCGTRAYNGHNGADITPWPFWWRAMDNDHVVVVAAAAGIVIDVVENQVDDNCLLHNVPSNIVSILHTDSSVSSYLHIKASSAMVFENDFVFEGQRLAYVGSSGRSALPHLHFSIRDKNGVDIEPWKTPGDCNTKNPDSWWQNQRPYWEPQVNRITTHFAHPDISGPDNACPSEEVPRLRNNFSAGDSIFFYIFFRDIQTGDNFSIDVLQPDGTTWYSSSGQHNGSNFSRYFANRSQKLPTNAQPGTWKVIVNYRSVIYRHYFTVNCVSSYVLTSQTGSYGRIASNFIESTAIALNNDKVRLQAGVEIILKPGFEARAGSTFKARIKPCDYSE